jgi:hypothetical protein
MEKNKIIIMGASFGFLSGLINAGILSLLPENLNALFLVYLAGIPYGLITGWYFSHTLPVNKKLFRAILWTVISGVSYYSGALTSTWTHQNIGNQNFLAAGFVGAFILALGFYIIYSSIPVWSFISVLVTGALVAHLVSKMYTGSDELNYELNFYSFYSLLYIVWQCSITTLLTLGFLYQKGKSA